MSDLNAVLEGRDEEPQGAEPAPQEQEPQAEAAGEPEASPPDAGKAESPSEPDEVSGLKAAIAAQRERYRMERERREELERQLQQSAQKPPEKPQEQPKNERPILDQFEDYDEYIEAITDWKTEQAIEKREQKRAESDKQAKAQQEQEATIRAYQERAAQLGKPDFDQVVQSIPVYLGEATQVAIYTSEKGPEIAYYLGQNHQEAAQIAGMTPHQQMLAVGRLEAKLSSDFEQAVQQEVSQAPNLPGSLAMERAAGTNNQQVVTDDPLEDILGR